MIAQLLHDQSEPPQVFRWLGELNDADVRSWVTEVGIEVPADLVWLWRVTGGGTMFETEQLLRPIRADDGASDVEPVNDLMHERGVPVSYVVFHEGFVDTAWDQDAKVYRTVSPSDPQPGESFSSLADWYENCIRKEFAQRYGFSYPDEST